LGSGPFSFGFGIDVRPGLESILLALAAVELACLTYVALASCSKANARSLLNNNNNWGRRQINEECIKC